jgi:predicted peptidase
MDIAEFNSYGMGDYANRTENFPFIIVAPQTSNDWYASLLDQTLNEIITAYSVDTNRIYLTGFSMGGWGTYLMATEYPTRFAAVAPVAGWWQSEDAYKLRDLPVWIFHDIGDTEVNYSFAQAMYDSLIAYGGDVRLTTYYNYVHNCWNETYADPALYDWFLSYQRQ